MRFSSLFRKNEIEITPVKILDNRLVFYIKNGKGLLRPQYGSYEGKGLFSLTFDGIPLTKFHGDEYLCPTCEKLVSAGYGLDKCDDKDHILQDLSERLNAPFEDLEKSFDDIKPLLSLLPTGYYLLSDEELFPTDGEDAFFWAIGNTPKFNSATCPIYDKESFIFSETSPKYLLPTQPPKLFDRTRAEYYRGRENTRAIAYYLEGYLCALLDGHHKATAAALNGRPVKTLVITAPSSFTFPDPLRGTRGSINFPEIQLSEDELLSSFKSIRESFGDNRMTENETKNFMTLQDKSFDNYAWSPDILDSAKHYCDANTLASIEWAGDLSDARLDDIIQGEECPSTVKHVIRALYYSSNPRFVDFAIELANNPRFLEIRSDIFLLLSKVRDQRVEDFFVDFLTFDDRVRPWLTKVADDYFVPV